VGIDTPAGFAEARAHMEGGRVRLCRSSMFSTEAGPEGAFPVLCASGVYSKCDYSGVS